jgi:hypothetical protein
MVICRVSQSVKNQTRAGLRNVSSEEKDEVILMLVEAIRLTQEYCGDRLLPPVEGWSWYDAIRDDRVKEVLLKYNYRYSILNESAHLSIGETNATK